MMVFIFVSGLVLGLQAELYPARKAPLPSSSRVHPIHVRIRKSATEKPAEFHGDWSQQHGSKGVITFPSNGRVHVHSHSSADQNFWFEDSQPKQTTRGQTCRVM